MKERSWLYAWGIGFFLFGTGLIWSVTTFIQWPADQARLQRKWNDKETLAELEASQDSLRAAQAAFLLLEASDSVSFNAWMRETLPHVRADVRPRDRTELTPEWRVERIELVLDEVLLEDIGDIMVRAGSLRPPWRLSEAQLRASDRIEGAAKASMIYERVLSARSPSR